HLVAYMDEEGLSGPQLRSQTHGFFEAKVRMMLLLSQGIQYQAGGVPYFILFGVAYKISIGNIGKISHTKAEHGQSTMPELNRKKGDAAYFKRLFTDTNDLQL